jgi:hypothetical protein
MLSEQHPTKSLTDFIKKIVETKSKVEEDNQIKKALEQIKNELGPNNPHQVKMENCIKILYGDMLGRNVQFSFFYIVNLVEN